MPRTRAFVSLISALAVALTLLAVTAGNPATAGAPTAQAKSTEKAGPGYHEPKVSDCYDYGARGLYAISGPKSKVSCEKSHRALIVATPHVKGQIDRKHPDAVFEKIGHKCYRAMYRVLGHDHKTRALTAYSLSFYLPTQAELDKGAKWVRCDLILWGGNRIEKLPEPFIPDPIDDTVAMCVVDLDKNPTVCERKHRFRATGTVKVKGASYPSQQTFAELGRKKCRAKTSTDGYHWRWPTKQAWKAGRHLITCYDETKS